MKTLSADVIAERLAALPGWRHDPHAGGALVREFRFAGFAPAFAFMTEVALQAERMDHHPDWTNVYDRVSIRLSTHAVGGVTERDLALAALIDRAAERGSGASGA